MPEHVFRKYYGAKDLLTDTPRWVLYLRDTPVSELARYGFLKDRISKVREFRPQSKRKATLEAANTPSEFALDTVPDTDYIIIPRVTSERRLHLPIAKMDKGTVASDANTIIPEYTPYIFALLSSRLHISWLSTVGGRLKSDYRYSVGLVYNTFPLPPKTDLSKLAPYGQAILDARANHPDATLADLYDPDLMPPDLRRAHAANDRAVDMLYRRTGFDSDRDRIEHLFALYEKMVQPLTAKGPKRRRKSH